MVKDGSKPGTIRAFRKYPVKAGQVAHLYYGMRTKFCMKLVEPSPVIKAVKVRYINDTGGVALIDRANWMNPGIVSLIELYGKIEVDKWPSVRWLNNHERNLLAWADGFRYPADSPQVDCSFELMVRFWKQTHALPFVGNYILWGNDPLMNGANATVGK